ncbi:hypothetical protein Tco_1259624 [Tanacetum coccineum]
MFLIPLLSSRNSLPSTEIIEEAADSKNKKIKVWRILRNNLLFQKRVECLNWTTIFKEKAQLHEKARAVEEALRLVALSNQNRISNLSGNHTSHALKQKLPVVHPQFIALLLAKKVKAFLKTSDVKAMTPPKSSQKYLETNGLAPVKAPTMKFEKSWKRPEVLGWEKA